MQGPLRYPVEILNDDVTPFSIVVQVLTEVFGYSSDEALALTEQVDQEGKAVVGEYIFEIAETKISEVHRINELNDLNIQVNMDTTAEKELLESEEAVTEELLQALIDAMKKDNKDDDNDK